MSTDPVPGSVRTCVGCRERAAKRELLRVVAGDRGSGLEVLPDDTAVLDLPTAEHGTLHEDPAYWPAIEDFIAP